MQMAEMWNISKKEREETKKKLIMRFELFMIIHILKIKVKRKECQKNYSSLNFIVWGEFLLGKELL